MNSVKMRGEGSVRERHRQRLLDAARLMIASSGIQAFSVEELAERAGMSRRTVFNHFATIDDIVASTCAQEWAVVIDDFRDALDASASPIESPAAMFEVVAGALRTADAPGIISYLWNALGGFDATDQRPQQIFHATFSRTTADLAHQLTERSADVERLEAELILSSLMSGAEVIAHHWIARTGATTDPVGRAVWLELLDHLIQTLRDGYRPSGPSKETE